MFSFWKADKKGELQGHKTLKIKGQRFVIRKLNPLLDFSPEKMPQIFSSQSSRRKAPATPPEIDEKKVIADMMTVVEVGMVGIIGAGSEIIALVPVGKAELKGRENGITVEDLFRDPDVGARLYWEIMSHSMDKFTGLKKVFFSLLNKHLFYTLSPKNTA